MGTLDDNIMINLREIYCDDGNWAEITQNHVYWQALLSVMLNLEIVLTEDTRHRVIRMFYWFSEI
jgi:hypothetical protein